MAAVLVLMSLAAFNIYKKYRESSENRKRAQGELESLEQRNRELSSRIERLKTERGLEEEIRKKFNVAKEGEGVVIIVPKSGTSSSEDIKNKETFLDRLRAVLEIF